METWGTFGSGPSRARTLPDVSLTVPTDALHQQLTPTVAAAQRIARQGTAFLWGQGAAETLPSSALLHQVLQQFGRLSRWTDNAVVTGGPRRSAAADIAAWYDEGKANFRFQTFVGSGKSYAACAAVAALLGRKRDRRLIFVEPKAAASSFRRDVYDLVLRDEAHRSQADPTADIQIGLNGGQLSRALTLFASLAGLQDWLHQRRTGHLQDDQGADLSVSETAEPLSEACGVLRLAVPLIPRAPGCERPDAVEHGDYVLGA
ncbi:hypothetical protein [Streptomyces sp. NPDC006132]|uniref:hypothetical protein n=1 Tax=Streptomyces sp. NPDC006132 TaxID=3156732 RepID=UPI0033E56FCD